MLMDGLLGTQGHDESVMMSSAVHRFTMFIRLGGEEIPHTNQQPEDCVINIKSNASPIISRKQTHVLKQA